MRQCKAKTKAGKRCKSAAQKDREVCLAHDQERRVSAGFGGPQEGSGRPRRPRAIEELRRRIEGDIDRWLKPLEDGLTAERAIVVGDGPHARLEFAPDYPTRLRAMQLAFERTFGKPAQALDVKHSHEESEVDAEIRKLLSQMPATGTASANGHS